MRLRPARQATQSCWHSDGYTALATLRDKLGHAPDITNNTATFQDSKALLKRASATLKKKLKAHDQGGDRSSAAYAAIMTALREGFSDDEIAALVEAHPQGVGERYAGAKASKLRQDIRRIRGSRRTMPSPVTVS
jgi:hypothetical protein